MPKKRMHIGEKIVFPINKSWKAGYPHSKE
jgi:hypothetical protein